MSDDGLMQYNPAHVNQLLDNLGTHHANLQNAHNDAHNAHTRIMSVWNGAGAEAYAAAFAKYKEAHENVIQVLKSGRDGVDQAQAAAHHADGKIAGMFGGGGTLQA
jgi:WXG100 family type VII secretion target